MNMEMKRNHPDSHDLACACGVTIFLYVAAVVYSILVQQPLFADGGHFFLKILEEKSVMDPGNWPRTLGHYFTEIPILLALNFTSIRDVSILSYLFSSGFYLAQASCLLACLWISWKTERNCMLFAVMGIIGISGNVMFVTVQDGTLMSYLFWPLLFYLTLMKRFSTIHAIVAIGLALIASRTYESAMFNNSMLLCVLGLTASTGWKDATRLTRAAWLLMAGLLAAGIYVAVYSVLHPIYPSNQANFLESIRSMTRNPQVLFTTVSLALACFHLLRDSARFFRASMLVLGVAGLLIALSPLLFPSLTPPWHHYYARSYVAYVLPVFGLMTFYVIRFRKNISSMQWKRAWTVCLVLSMVQIGWHGAMTFQWQGYRRVFIEELVTHRGPIRFEDAMISKPSVGNQLLNPLSWGWTHPTMSIIWSPNHDVTTVIANPVAQQKVWEPIKVHDLDTFPKLADYGFSYEKYRKYLETAPAASSLPVDYGIGWSLDEVTHRWAIASHAEITIVNESKTPISGSVAFNLLTVKSRNVSIYMNKKPLSSLSLTGNDPPLRFERNAIPLLPGPNTLTIETDVPPELPGSGDMRKLSFGISDLRVNRQP